MNDLTLSFFVGRGLSVRGPCLHDDGAAGQKPSDDSPQHSRLDNDINGFETLILVFRDACRGGPAAVDRPLRA